MKINISISNIGSEKPYAAVISVDKFDPTKQSLDVLIYKYDERLTKFSYNTLKGKEAKYNTLNHYQKKRNYLAINTKEKLYSILKEHSLSLSDCIFTDKTAKLLTATINNS